MVLTERQLNAVMAIARVLGWPAYRLNQLSESMFGSVVSELSRENASLLIQRLQELVAQGEDEMANKAQVTKSSEVKRKRQPPEQDPVEASLEDIDVLLGDGNASASFTRTLRLAGGDYNAVVIGSSIHVGVKCNQDKDTVEKAIVECRKIADEMMGKDMASMQRRLDSLLEGRK